MKYDHQEVPFSMDKYSIHGRNTLSMDLKNLWVQRNISLVFSSVDHADEMDQAAVANT